jgi:hypothetical protein
MSREGVPGNKGFPTTHGMKGTKVYEAWSGAKKRCYNKNYKYYRRYGGRGLIVDEKFINDFLAFYEEVGDPPSPKHSLDRIDNDKGYIQGNMRWVLHEKQMRNQGARKNNKTGVTGVYYKTNVRKKVTHIYAVACWRNLQGQQETKYFSCNILGKEKAFEMAKEHRERMISEMNEAGAGYSEAHGK